MTTFADREKEFENRFKHDEELRFKTTARRNRMVGLWAAQQLGLRAEAAEAYAKDLVAIQFQAGGDQRVLDKLFADLSAKDPAITPSRISFELDHFTEQAKEQLMRE
ncbi:MAG TPA: DUF1476 domain-containing protein [Stellaceae bacterium]|nr:DUF1476 domain-containing protein [Stellaceae bacterium]